MTPELAAAAPPRSDFATELSDTVKLALPIVLAQAGQALMGVVDTAVVGRYSATAQGESKTISVARGSSGVLFANIQNDGLTADALKVVGPTGQAGFTVHYFRGATDVTSQVNAGTFSTGTLAPGASVTLKIVVHLSATSANQGSFLIQATSKPGAHPDGVRAIINAQ